MYRRIQLTIPFGKGLSSSSQTKISFCLTFIFFLSLFIPSGESWHWKWDQKSTTQDFSSTMVGYEACTRTWQHGNIWKLRTQVSWATAIKNIIYNIHYKCKQSYFLLSKFSSSSIAISHKIWEAKVLIRLNNYNK